jgi:hypothetical protein
VTHGSELSAIRIGGPAGRYLQMVKGHRLHLGL